MSICCHIYPRKDLLRARMNTVFVVNLNKYIVKIFNNCNPSEAFKHGTVICVLKQRYNDLVHASY